jgi:ABC-type uncharacterized transport system fused permease/ATPase subunit
MKFSEGICGLFANLVKPIADITLYTYKLVKLTGWIGPSLIGMYMFCSWIFISLIRPNFSKIISKEQNLEGDFRYCHVRTSTNGESIAFYGGDELEKQKADETYEKLYKHRAMKLKYELSFGIFNDIFVLNLPMVISWVVSSIPVFFGALKNKSRGVLAKELR